MTKYNKFLSFQGEQRTRWIQCRVPEVVPDPAQVPVQVLVQVLDLDRLDFKEEIKVPKEVTVKEKAKKMVQCTEVLRHLRHLNR